MLSEDEKAEIQKWDEILRKEGLGMSRGRHWRKLTYVGGAKELDQFVKTDVVDIVGEDGYV